MPRFFIAPTDQPSVNLTGGDAAHISRSLRMGLGDKIVLSDGEGWDYHGEISYSDKDLVTVIISQKVENTTEPAVAVTLYQALPKGDKFSFVTEKAVELGVTRIVPVLTSRCISRPNPKSMERKIQRYQNTALEAAKQSNRGIIPTVEPLLSFEEALEQSKQADLRLFFYEEEKKPLQQILEEVALSKLQTVSLWIGSEGGFSPDEVAGAKAAGFSIASLGPRILRTETAPLVALSALFYALGEF